MITSHVPGTLNADFVLEQNRDVEGYEFSEHKFFITLQVSLISLLEVSQVTCPSEGPSSCFS